MMTGITGLRLLHRNSSTYHNAPQSLINIPFPNKATVTSQQMVNDLGQPTYRKDIKV